LPESGRALDLIRFGIEPNRRTLEIIVDLAYLQFRSKLSEPIISSREERGRHIEPERLGGLQVDHELVSGRRLHREVGRLLAFEDSHELAGNALNDVSAKRTVGQFSGSSGSVVRETA
jgi:hypothetical protein